MKRSMCEFEKYMGYFRQSNKTEIGWQVFRELEWFFSGVLGLDNGRKGKEKASKEVEVVVVRDRSGTESFVVAPL
jgi:hypothetical protein